MKITWFYAAGVFFLLSQCPAPAFGQVEGQPDTPVLQHLKDKEQERIRELETRLDDTELQLLRLQAMVEPEEEEEILKPVQFQGKGRALQMLNPELSAGIDLFGIIVHKDGRFYGGSHPIGMFDPDEMVRSGFFVREAAFQVQSTLDPFSMLKIAFALEGGLAHLEEAYVVYNSIAPRLGLTVGKFRQSFGVVNRWHRHSIDQFDYPLMLKIPFGPDGLTQTGVSLNWLMPSWWAHAQELVIQVTNSQNEQMFAGDFFSIPSGLLRFKNYWDLNRDTYLEFGLTGLMGFNTRTNWDETGSVELAGGSAGTSEPSGSTTVTMRMVDEPVRISWAAAADLTFNWEPVSKSKYRGLVWRTEFLYAQQETPFGSEDFWGGYTYLEGKLVRSLFLGMRGDLIRDFEPLAEDNQQFTYQLSPYLTWWQSEFVKFRVQYDALSAHGEPLEHRVIMQMECAAGPHKHERY
jgi:hypothetical protein